MTLKRDPSISKYLFERLKYEIVEQQEIIDKATKHLEVKVNLINKSIFMLLDEFLDNLKKSDGMDEKVYQYLAERFRSRAYIPMYFYY